MKDMKDRVTFDFVTGEIIFDTDHQTGTEIDPDLKSKKSAIMAAAGFEVVDGKEIREFAEQLIKKLLSE